MVKFGIIGIGSMGTNYFNWFNEGKIDNGRVVAVCDVSPQRIAWANKNAHDVTVLEDYKALIHSGLVDAVMVVTPHYFHPAIAIEAMENGLHTLVDKPAGVYTKQIQEMNDCALKHPELKFSMMFNQRTNPLYIKLKELIDNEEIGKIRKITWIITSWWRTQKYYDSSPWRATWWGEGGGILVNQAPHQLDLWQWIFGMPQMVRGYLKYGSHRDIMVEDDVTAFFEYENGTMGTLITCTHDAIGSDRLEIQGNKGKIIIEDINKLTIRRMFETEDELNQKLDFRQMLALMRGETGEKLYSEELFEIPENWEVQHIDVLKNFVAAIETGTELLAPGMEGIKAVRLANAIHLSSWLNTEVNIPFDENLFYIELQKKITEEKKLR